MNALPQAFNDNPSEPSVFNKNGQVMTNSRDVAGYFRKQHKDVLRAIDNLDCSNEYRQRNFALTSQTVGMPKGGTREARTFDMTKDGFTCLLYTSPSPRDRG